MLRAAATSEEQQLADAASAVHPRSVDQSQTPVKETETVAAAAGPAHGAACAAELTARHAAASTQSCLLTVLTFYR